MLNTVFNRFRRRMGFSYWSLSAYLKLRVKNAVNYIGAFEEALAGEAKRVGADGVVCGHIHHARIADLGGFRYVNTGDWVESCTAIAEHHDGRLEIVRWTRNASAEAARDHYVSDDAEVPAFNEAAE
jgi:UDP-2,3-diacylglucosamine pyrophosphatase LpxH